MKYHHCGYIYGDPRIQSTDGRGGLFEVPDEVDVLIVGSGPAGVMLASQLAQFPDISTALIEARSGPLKLGHADGIQSRTLETFEAFGVAGSVMEESQEITETAFWRASADDPSRIVRAFRVPEDPESLSEYPHVIVNQARIVDHFREVMRRAPARLEVTYDTRFHGLHIDAPAQHSHPVQVQLSGNAAIGSTEIRTVRCKYLVGADGAHSKVRAAIGTPFLGTSSSEAWGVIGLLLNTDFPDIRRKCIIQSGREGSVIVIPREGGHLVRLYVHLGHVDGDRRRTDLDGIGSAEIIDKAARIFHPYHLDVKEVVWHSVYIIGHRLAEHFDNRAGADADPTSARVFIVGDAAHTHSPKLGQGMNVSMQDSFNLGWKLAHVLRGDAPAELLTNYSAEREAIGRDIIAFDKRWADRVSASPKDAGDDAQVEAAYRSTNDFAQGLETCYAPSLIVDGAARQALAAGLPIGRRFHSARVQRVGDLCTVQLGHLARADGRWRLYVFADRTGTTASERVTQLAQWIEAQPAFQTRAAVPPCAGERRWFDVKIVYPLAGDAVDLQAVPRAFMPAIGPFDLVDYDHVFGLAAEEDLFALRGIDARGAMVLVRPDQYVSAIFGLDETAALEKFIGGFLNVGGSMRT